jgi:hypothetical protein
MAPVGFRVAYSSALVRGTAVTTAAVGADVATTVAATGTVVDMATVADMAMAAAIAGTAAALPAAASAEATRFTAVAPSMVEEASTVAVAGSTAADTVAEVIANRTWFLDAEEDIQQERLAADAASRFLFRSWLINPDRDGARWRNREHTRSLRLLLVNYSALHYKSDILQRSYIL